jgi:hypothetical protein
MSTCSFHKRHWVVESDVKTAYPVLGGLKACNVLSIQFLDFYNLHTQIWDGFIAPDILLLMFPPPGPLAEKSVADNSTNLENAKFET